MDTLPQEMLVAVAMELSVPDVRRFRKVCRRWAYAGFPALVRHFSYLNTVETSNRFQELAQSPYALLGAARQLTIYNGEWPIALTQDQWHDHFLSIRKTGDRESVQLAYRRYQSFLAQEGSRTFESDVDRFSKLLYALPSLREVTIAHYHARRRKQYRQLRSAHFRQLASQILMAPYFESLVSEDTARILDIINERPRIQRLNVEGLLDPSPIPQKQHPTIRHLYLDSIIVGAPREELQTSAASFLACFPNLQSLSLRTAPGGPQPQTLPLRRLHWPELKFCEMTDLRTGEEELFKFVERHNIKCLILRRITLASGSWTSFFRRIRELPSRPRTVYDPNARLHGEEERSAVQRLVNFHLDNVNYPWPLTDTNDDISDTNTLL